MTNNPNYQIDRVFGRELTNILFTASDFNLTKPR